MSAVEEIQAAIDTLESMKAESTGGPWTLDWRPATDEHFIQRRYEFFGPQVEQVASGLMNVDADLIVTLHRTIDAQLAILRDFMERYSGDTKVADDWEPAGPSGRNALALARAINGGTQ